MFKLETGKTFSEYLKYIRIDQAKGYLRKWDYSMANIAEQPAFSNQSHSDKTFKQATGDEARPLSQAARARV